MKRLFVCLLFTAFLPIAASTTQNSSTNSTPFVIAVFAGHSGQGYWCECGSTGCICDPGETPNGQAVSRDAEDQDELSVEPTPQQGTDFGAIALMLVFFALTLSRLRG